MYSRSAKTVTGILLVVLFLITSVFSLVKTDMAMGAGGHETAGGNCFMPGMMASLCQMNPLEHIATWQNMFTAKPSQSGVVALLFLLLALVLTTHLLTPYKSTAPPKVLMPQSLFLYFKRHIPIINTLQEAFSSGILHPKIF